MCLLVRGWGLLTCGGWWLGLSGLCWVVWSVNGGVFGAVVFAFVF